MSSQLSGFDEAPRPVAEIHSVDHADTKTSAAQGLGIEGDPGSPEYLSFQMAELARELQSAHNSVAQTLEAITTAAVQTVPGADFACVTVVSRKQDVQTIAPTDIRAEKINAIQQSVGEGPCLQSLWESATVRVDDLDTDVRWPMFALAAVDLGIRSMMTVRLYVENTDLGALSFYSEKPSAFTPECEAVAVLLATHAAVALNTAELEANLTAAVDSRDVIGQAKGILMERYQLDSGRAFRLLVRVSQTTNVPLREVADGLLTTGEMPTVHREELPEA
ncbi:GAF and ANTAR domain-containing protein [Nakamurella antarctica]|uniref:GAF and ANTAR domain-containing protein n=1 Tax=Nakamurella antarctica TaxID=1902245 RepID=UPI0013DD8EB0|nr:GAF and ANTAR domain-containing protein [Nakamurella antarctica]